MLIRGTDRHLILLQELTLHTPVQQTVGIR